MSENKEKKDRNVSFSTLDRRVQEHGLTVIQFANRFKEYVNQNSFNTVAEAMNSFAAHLKDGLVPAEHKTIISYFEKDVFAPFVGEVSKIRGSSKHDSESVYMVSVVQGENTDTVYVDIADEKNPVLYVGSMKMGVYAVADEQDVELTEEEMEVLDAVMGVDVDTSGELSQSSSSKGGDTGVINQDGDYSLQNESVRNEGFFPPEGEVGENNAKIEVVEGSADLGEKPPVAETNSELDELVKSHEEDGSPMLEAGDDYGFDPLPDKEEGDGNIMGSIDIGASDRLKSAFD